jgi:hypothetical protein
MAKPADKLTTAERQLRAVSVQANPVNMIGRYRAIATSGNVIVPHDRPKDQTRIS